MEPVTYDMIILNGVAMPPGRDSFQVLTNVTFAVLAPWATSVLETGMATAIEVRRSDGPQVVDPTDAMWIRMIASEVNWRQTNP